MEMFADTTQKELTRSQRKATQSTDKWVAVVAGAGSGKTTVLIDRCLNIIGDKPENLDRLLAITFTEKAASQLKTRLRKALPAGAHHMLTTAWIGTIHAFCARILRNNSPLINLDPSFSILDENAFRMLAHETVHKTLVDLCNRRDPHAVLLTNELDFKHAASLMRELSDFRWHAKRTLECKPPADEKPFYDAVASCYAKIEAAIVTAMERLGCIDFQQLEIKTLELLTKVPSVRDAYQKKFSHILVDEFQDTSDIQSEIVFLLANPKVNCLAIVGDPRQSIYRFRGANVRCFETAVERIKKVGGLTISLDENFRSEPAIISFTNATFTDLWDKIGGNPPSPMKAARPEPKGGPAVHALLLDAPKELQSAANLRRIEADAIASYIGELAHDGKHRFGNITCLFQAMTTISEYETAFKKRGIPYRFYGGRGLLERQEIRDLIHALRYANDPKDDVALIGLLRSPLVGLSDDECAKMAGEDGHQLRASVKGDGSLSLLHFLESASQHLRPSEILKATVDLTGYEFVCRTLDPSGGMQANLDRLITIIATIEKEEPSSLDSIISFLEGLREKSARLGDPPAAPFGGDAVGCMTVHTAKGLEFNVVIVPDLLRQPPKNHGPWRFLRQEGVGFKLKDQQRPFGNRIETERFKKLVQIDEMEGSEETKRLLYVAMTRARDLLVLPIHHTDKKTGRWHNWLAPIAEKTNNEHVVAIRRRAEEIRGHTVPLLCKEGSGEVDHNLPSLTLPYKGREYPKKIFSVSELETYERCPYEYYLKYTLGLPANDILQEKERLPANVRGSIVHAVLQKYDPHKNISEMIASECIDASVYPDKKTISDIEKVISVFAKNPLAKEMSKGKRELRFDYRFGQAIITGSIDWLLPSGEGFDIVDFKTDSIQPGEVENRAREYELQLTAYALAAQASLPQRIKSTMLYFLEPDVVHTTAMDEHRAQEGRSKIDAIIKNITKGNFEIGEKSPPCYKCPYNRNRMCNEAKTTL